MALLKGQAEGNGNHHFGEEFGKTLRMYIPMAASAFLAVSPLEVNVHRCPRVGNAQSHHLSTNSGWKGKSSLLLYNRTIESSELE